MGYRIDKLGWEGVVGREELGVFLNGSDTGILGRQFFLLWVYPTYCKTSSVSSHHLLTASSDSHLQQLHQQPPHFQMYGRRWYTPTLPQSASI